jgi:TPR repeat protein
MIREVFITVIVLGLLSCSTAQEKKYLLKGQSDDFPLYTELDSATIYPQIERLSRSSYRLSMEELDSFLVTIEPCLEEEDPLAMLGFYLVYSNELVASMKSSRTDEKNDYLLKLADKNCSSAELIIAEDFYKGRNTFISDPDKALKYLEGAILHGDEFNSSFGNIFMAEIYSDPKNNFNVAIDSSQALEYLRSALKSGNFNIEMTAKMKLPNLYKKLKE